MCFQAQQNNHILKGKIAMTTLQNSRHTFFILHKKPHTVIDCITNDNNINLPVNPIYSALFINN